jgi:uncharacterized protein (DUF1919 family)
MVPKKEALYMALPTPQTARVCPKSSSCLSKPILMLHQKPPIPIVELIINLERSFNDFLAFLEELDYKMYQLLQDY